ncbi:metallophosphoesterase [Limosilactobacillus antri]|uniref:metallophosphoesterase n=1 Tax=Limosilactobacillus antri TaxID=227943 RepID=UPI001F57612F|nr:metallophosphoesterase [Limosilactobacillus antri]
MTKVLIVSDNHGDRAILERLVAGWKAKVDLMIHCGDSEIPSQDPLMQSFVRVAGNNDWHLGYAPDQLVLVGGARILVTHGHHYGVGSSMTPLMLKGESTGADIVCFGHTHQLFATVERGMLMVNPGSISLPRGQFAVLGGTFAVVTVTPQMFTVDFYDRDSHRQPKLHQEFSREERAHD